MPIIRQIAKIGRWTPDKPKFLILILLALLSISFSDNWTLSPDNQYVYWSNANAIINCTATSRELITQTQICDFIWKDASPITLNASLSFNLAEGVKPKAAYLWQNMAHLLYHGVNIPINHSITITPNSYKTSNASCDWGVGATKINATSSNGSQVYCFDSFINNSGTYTLYSVWNESISTPYTSWFADWNDISSSFAISQFGSYQVATIQGTWNPNETKRVKFIYDTQPNTVGKFNIYFHTGSAQDAVNNPANIKLELDPWWNASWGKRQNFTIVNPNGFALTNFSSRIIINLDGSQTNGSDIRVTWLNGSTEQSIGFWRQTGNFTYGNATQNTTGGIWILMPAVSASNETIYVYFNASGVTDASLIDNAFLFGDDFDSVLNTSKWVNDTNGAVGYSIANSEINFTVPSTSSAYMRLTMVSNLSNPETTAVIKIDSMSIYNSTANQLNLLFELFAPQTYAYNNATIDYRTYDKHRYIGQQACAGSTNCYDILATMFNNVPEIWSIFYNDTSTYVNASTLSADGTRIIGNYTQAGAQRRYRFALWRDAGSGWAAFDYVYVKNGMGADTNYVEGAIETNANNPPVLSYTNNSVANNSVLPHNYAYFEVNYTEANRANTTLNLNPNGGVSWCYQGRADVATLCGGLNNGTYYLTYDTNPTLAYDDNYTTYATSGVDCGGGNTCGYAYANFTLPAYAQNTSLWMPKDTTGETTTTQNISILNCSLAPLQLKVYQVSYGLGGADTIYSCWNGTGFQQLKKNSDAVNSAAVIYEIGAMNWNISTPNTGSSYEMTCNTTICYYNLTNLSNGQYNASVTMNNTGGLSTTLGTINFTIESSPPTISIISPVNQSYNSTNISLNYVAVDANLDKCWYRLNGNATTIALPNCTNTTFIGLEGVNNLTVYANNTLGLESNTLVSFIIDTIFPSLIIQLPINGTTYSSPNGITLNYTVSDVNLDKCRYDLYGATTHFNIALTNCANATLNASWLANGTNTIYLYANDTAGHQNTSIIVFYVNPGTPSITIQSPIAKNYSSTSVDLNYTAVDAVAMDSCWYKLDAGANTSLSNCANITLTSLSQGGHTITVYVNNTGGGFNSSSVTFGVDTVNPAITIQSPTATNYTTTNISLNYIVSDADLGSCWYKLNAGANTSLASCDNTTFIAAQGSNTITVYVNDTLNNFNSSSVTFFVDSINPAITIQSPTVTSYNTTNISLNYVASDTNRDKCWYKLNAGANTTLTSCANTTFIAAQGSNTITVYVNDTLNNFNSSSVTFTVDTIKPAVAIQAPANQTYAFTSLSLNYTASDTNLDKCWYKLDAGSNTSLASCANATLSGLSQGSHTVTVYANDTVNNVNSSSVSFGVDTIAPSLAVQSPVQGTTYNATNTSLKYTVSDAVSGVNMCWYSLNGGANTTLTACINTTFIALLGGNTITIYSNDSMNNVNSSTITFTVNSTIAIAIQSPQVIVYNHTLIDLNYTVQGLNIDKCWYSLNGAANSTLGGCANTSITGTEGANQIVVYTNNTLGNITSASVSFTVDTVNPQISIQSPTASNYTTTNITLNYVASDVNRDKCWYVLNGGSNVALASCSNTTFTAAQGSNTVVVHVNDTANNKNSSSVTFIVDSLPPIIALSSPLAQYYPNSTVSLIYTVSDATSGVDACWYVLDGGVSVSLVGCANASLSGLTQGNHTILLYANDSWGNENSTMRTFWVNFIPPSVSISSPQNKSYLTITSPLSISVAYAVTSLTPDSCWYVLDGGASTPLPGCTGTNINFTIGPHTLIIYANDTFSRVGSNIVGFGVVNGSVSVTIVSPLSAVYNFTVIPLNYGIQCLTASCTCIYIIDGVTFPLVSCGNTTLYVSAGNHSLEVIANDTSLGGTLGSDTVSFAVALYTGENNDVFNNAANYIRVTFPNGLDWIPIIISLCVGITLMSVGVNLGIVYGGIAGLVSGFVLNMMSPVNFIVLSLYISVGVVIGVWLTMKTK